ncbi:MAG: hypothetical protein DRI57_22075 [Deltaproteobacteria bacterium]|nr:MAG: hypothetical protein DRI57_22075 [Deltaproteobacteria bacterium]
MKIPVKPKTTGSGMLIVLSNKKAENCEIGEKVRTPDTYPIDFVKLKRGQGYKNKHTGEIWVKSHTSHRGDKWKVGRSGKPPTKGNKISVKTDGTIVKIDPQR